jgi:hypothetical protein
MVVGCACVAVVYGFACFHDRAPCCRRVYTPRFEYMSVPQGVIVTEV